MTQEYLQEANKISHAITETGHMIDIVEGMLHSDSSLYIGSRDHGEITVDETTRLDIIDIVLRALNNKKGELEDKLRMM